MSRSRTCWHLWVLSSSRSGKTSAARAPRSMWRVSPRSSFSMVIPTYKCYALQCDPQILRFMCLSAPGVNIDWVAAGSKGILDMASATGRRKVQQKFLLNDVDRHGQLSQPDLGHYASPVLSTQSTGVSRCLCAEHDARRLMERGMARRRTNETRMNAESSRSHAVLTLHLESSRRTDSGLLAVRSSRLNLIDLAGIISLSVLFGWCGCQKLDSECWQLHRFFLACLRSVPTACSSRMMLHGLTPSHQAHDSTANGGYADSKHELRPHAQAVSGTSPALPLETGSKRPALSISPSPRLAGASPDTCL